MSSLTLVTAPSIRPHTIDEIKAHCRVDDSMVDEDALLWAYYTAALHYLEGKDGIINRALITQTWDLKFDQFPVRDNYTIDVPLAPLQSVTSITYTDENGNTGQTWAAANYDVDTDSEPGRITPAYGASYPATRYEVNAVTVRFVAGYGANRSDVPEPLRVALLQLTAHWYERREPVEGGGTLQHVPIHVDRLIAPYRRNRFHGGTVSFFNRA